MNKMKAKQSTALLLLIVLGATLLPAWPGSAMSKHAVALNPVPTMGLMQSRHGGHPCCPHSAIPVQTQMSRRADPCDDGHRCCFSQNHGIPFALPSTSQTGRFRSQVVCTKLWTDIPASADCEPETAIISAAIHSYSAFSTVLRN